VRKYLEKIVKAGRRASDLTRQMLAYSGQAKYELQPLALNDLVDELSDLLRAALPKSVHLDLQLESGLPMVEADSAQFQQVIMNLLINSAEAIGHEPGTVTIRTSTRTFSADELGKQYIGKPLAAGTYACLEVRDTGPGIPPETLSRIFEPFFTTKTTGRGLGLSALLGIVRSHNGAVHVESQAGVGTTFTIVLPPMTSSKPVPPSRQFNSASLPEGSTVLVVDDEEDIRDVVQAVLESRGAHVITASDGPAGIEQFREHADDVDVVLLDMTMPGLGGDAVFREIMSIKPDARVIISSGYSEQDTLARLDDKRLAGFVHKPYTAQLLIDEINTALLGQSAS
jgi:CheY-like chemotaxis protein